MIERRSPRRLVWETWAAWLCPGAGRLAIWLVLGTSLLVLWSSLPAGARMRATHLPDSGPATEVPPLGARETDVRPGEVITRYAYLPIITRFSTDCAPIPGASYGSFDVPPPATDRPAAQHADLNLALRGYEPANASLGLVDYVGPDDAKAPQLYRLFADARIPDFTAAYQVYDWNWDCNCRGALLNSWDATLLGMGVAPAEIIQVPASGYAPFGQNYAAVVLYAAPGRVTLKYTPNDNVVDGYTIHVENVCVEPSLLALYQQLNAAGRDFLPALRAGQPFGRALEREIRVAIRDCGTFLDPRSRKDWWDER